MSTEGRHKPADEWTLIDVQTKVALADCNFEKSFHR